MFRVVRFWLRLQHFYGEALKSARIFEGLFHAGPTYAGRFFRSSRAAPMSFQAHAFVVANFAQSGKLGRPIDESGTDWRPFDFAACVFHGVLGVAVVDAVLR